VSVDNQLATSGVSNINELSEDGKGGVICKQTLQKFLYLFNVFVGLGGKCVTFISLLSFSHVSDTYNAFLH